MRIMDGRGNFQILLILAVFIYSSTSYNYAASKYDKSFGPPHLVPPHVPPPHGSGALVHRYSASSYYYKKPKSGPRNKFVPGNQFCPDNGMTVCDKIKKYPSDHIYGIVNNVMSMNFNFSSVFGDERLGDQVPKFGAEPEVEEDGYIVYQHSIQYNYHVPPPAHLAESYPWQYYNDDKVKHHQYQHRRRRGRAKDVETPCRSTTKFITPEAGMNENSQWKYVVNVGNKNPDYQQVIKVEICQSAGDICSEDISLPFGFKQACRQKYIKKRMLAVDGSGDGVSEENFFVPSCCVCEISRDEDGGDNDFDFRRKKRDAKRKSNKQSPKPKEKTKEKAKKKE